MTPRNSTTTFEPGDEPNRCCAKSKSTGKRCGNPIVAGRRVCRIHGGLGGAPVKHGRYAKGLGRFREAYAESIADPGLMDLRETLALLDVVVKRNAERLEDSDTPAFRRRALELYTAVRAASTPQDAAAAMTALGELLRSGVSEDSALDDLAVSAERLARRQEKAWQIRLDAATALNAKDLMAVMARWADIVLEEVPREAAARVIRRIDGEVLGTGAAATRLSVGDSS